MTRRIASLPLNERGYPVPWFVAWIDGKPDFRVIGEGKREMAVKGQRCWICGERLGAFKAFVIGPMCAVNRVSSEPPCHQDCAEWSALACPFLTKPKMVRRENDLPEEKQDAAGFALDRNPGVALVYTTRTFTIFKAHAGTPGWLIQIGEPISVKWFAEGREATRAEVMASVDSGMPALMEMAAAEGDHAIAALIEQRVKAQSLFDQAS